ncbi:hypothetical protein FDB30_03650 [Clostridium botulinum]|uniref:Uncharacterized protein n=1 Tax=Clostridium botulinum TaxID=1491 RepID=A0A6B4FDZ4_CLOBO|nr:hypothetical protein [Clostridium botulinum]KAI3350759.1 hypothetical protein CIT18_01600 [Clostridium botulinum]MBY7025184.1 hypothetical protein [Clostridium botulinum]NFE58160.1 hypothetical protein [Clostridium botulinum]NFE83364.1 hypothetical protein [Clostridium botulinum]NFE94497.1 hypothetical protein [Clostridium botulinum]
MFSIFNSLSTTDKIQILSIIFSSLLSLISVCIALGTLKQTNKISLDSNRAYIIFYIDKNRAESSSNLVIKNFGKTGGKLISLTLDPTLDYEKSKIGVLVKPITNYSNIFLAPGQSIKSAFFFESYPDTKFNISISYETCGKLYNESYTIDLDYYESILEASPTAKDTNSILKQISQNIGQVSDKLS